MSTLSNKKAKSSYEEAEAAAGAELRDKAAVSAAPRPLTIAVSGGAVTSAPNLLAAAVTGQQRAVKPRMPDPAPEPELGPIELHVNRIHVTSAPAVPVPAAASVYMNVPKHPEYVNFHDSKHQYVNVPDAQPSSKRKPFILFCCEPESACMKYSVSTPQPRRLLTLTLSLFAEPLPKPRAAGQPGLSSAQLTPAGEAARPPAPDLHAAPPGGQDLKAAGARGKRPVPLPRRLSAISAAPPTATPPLPSPSPAATTPSPSPAASSSPSIFFAKSRENSAKKAGPGPGQPATSTPRRRTPGGPEVPTPTANFKSYRRIPSSSSSSASSEPQPASGVRYSPHRHKQPAPPAPSSSGTKLKSVTRLSFGSDSRPATRADSGLGNTSVSSADSVRLSSVSSAESPVASPTRILVTQPQPQQKARPGKYYDK